MRKLLALSFVWVACDGSAVDGTQRTSEPDATTATTPDVTADTTPLPEPTVLDGEHVEPAIVPPPPVFGTPLPGGETDGTAIIVAKDTLAGRFLYGMGASPDGLIASLGGGAGGLAPIRAGVVLVPGDGGGTLEIRALDGDALVPGADGLIESYPYMDVDAATVRVDFAAAETPIEIALSGQCRYELAEYELRGAPRYADALLTWAADEEYERQGGCNWAPRSAEGLHVHYLRHESASRGFKVRAEDPEGGFGFFLAGSDQRSVLARLPGLARDEPPQTYTYYLSPSFPEAMVPAAQQTFEAWNDALEDVIGRRPFAVAPAPADMIAWDPRYHVVLWDGSGGSGAIAPFTNDPDTGEIFQSFVVMYFGEVERLVERYQTFFDEHPELAAELAPVPARMSTPASFELPDMGAIGRATRPDDVAPRALTPRPFVRRPFAPDHVRQTMARHHQLGVDLSDEEVQHIIVVDFLLHEVGHNLGLRHNFIGSVDKHRHDDEHTSSSTMDYVIGMLDPGSYDRDAMRYAYGSTAPTKADYLYCTDETIELEPACVQWDYGHPIRAQLARVDGIFAAYAPEASNSDVDELFEDGTFDKELTRLRSLLNTTYEAWDETPVLTFEELLGRVDCGAECTSHVRLRNALSLYLLYARHVVTAYWEPNYPDVWLDFPTLSETQAALLMDTYFTLVTTRAEPLTLKQTIVGKLPTSAVVGAADLLRRLDAHFAAQTGLDSDEQAVKQAIASALSDL